MSNNPQSKKQKNSKLLSLEERVISFLEHTNQNNQKQPFKNNFPTIKDNLIPLTKDSDSSLSTQTQKEEKKCIISIDKKILKFAEPRFKISPTPFLQPKFSRPSDLSSSITSILKHNITESMTDLLKGITNYYNTPEIKVAVTDENKFILSTDWSTNNEIFSKL